MPLDVSAAFATFHGLAPALRDLAARLLRQERLGHTLWPTELLHEAFLRLSGLVRSRRLDGPVVLTLFARAMRRVLVDHARRRAVRERVCAAAAERAAATRSGFLLELDAALADLAAKAPRQAEVVELRFFGGLAVPEVAACLGVTERTVVRDWACARGTLRLSLNGGRDAR